MENQPTPTKSLRNCTSCTFAMRIPPQAPSIIGEYKCQLMPPQLVLLPTHSGPSLVSMFPTVTDKTICAQHRFASETENAPEKKLIS